MLKLKKLIENNGMFIVQWTPLTNRITLGQRQTDSNNQLILISDLSILNTRYERVIWDLMGSNLITLSVISLSGAHYC